MVTQEEAPQPGTTPATDPAPDSEVIPYISADRTIPEFTLRALIVGAILGIVFGASSTYLVLKIGMTVSASIPVAVLSITLFRVLSKAFGLRPATILENNIVQTTGSAGESIAFGLGVTMPVLLILGFEMTIARILLVSVLGGLLGILMMIPLRRAFIVHQHKELRFPEGTACAKVLIVGEEGGATAKTVFAGFGVAILFKFLNSGLHLFRETASSPLKILKGAVLEADMAPELLGVGYIIGPRISSIMVAGGVLAYLVLIPAIVMFAGTQSEPFFPGTKLVKEMSTDEIRGSYIQYIGAGAVAAGGIISMIRVLPMIFRSAGAGVRLFRAGRAAGSAPQAAVPRTERDLPVSVVVWGSLGLVAAIWLAPPLHMNLLGAVFVVLFGFLFVTVSSRLTGEIGSSSNPISGMTVATLLMTCLIFLVLGWTTPVDQVTALSVAAIVCIACSNGGTTSQDLKTGHLLGSTPSYQQLAILIGALTSAVAIGFVLKAMNDSATVYTQKDLPQGVVQASELSEAREGVGGRESAVDPGQYRVWYARPGNPLGALSGKYLVDDAGQVRYLVDPGITGRITQRDDGTKVRKFSAPQNQLMAVIIDGVLARKLPWGLVLLGVLIALTMELSGVPALPFAVGVYIPLRASAPIFIGGMVRYAIDRFKRRGGGEGESDTSPGVLLSTGYIAGGTIGGVILAFLAFNDDLVAGMNLGDKLSGGLAALAEGNELALGLFGLLAVLLALAATGKILSGGARGLSRRQV